MPRTLLPACIGHVDAQRHVWCGNQWTSIDAGQLGMLAALLNRGCLVNGPTNDGWTALHEAAANGHGLIVDKLIASGAQVSLLLWLCRFRSSSAISACLFCRVMLPMGTTPLQNTWLASCFEKMHEQA